MQLEKTAIDDVVIIIPKVFTDDRGFFLEAYRRDLFNDLGIDADFVQDNHSRSRKNTLRGLHFQWAPRMAKLMRVTRGEAFLVAVDIRKGSPTLGQWVGVTASEEDKRQVWAPAGFARGFCALSEVVDVQYKCTGIYNPSGESGILWNDPAIGIDWPVKDPQLSPKDRNAQTLAQWLARPESNFF